MNDQLNFYYFPGETQILVIELQDLDEFEVVLKNALLIRNELTEREYLRKGPVVFACVKHFIRSTLNIPIADAQDISRYRDTSVVNAMVRKVISEGCNSLLTIMVVGGKVSCSQLIGPLNCGHLANYFL